MRAARHKTDAVGFLQEHGGFDTAIEYKVEDAFSKPTPLERERAIDELRWSILDEVAGTEPFSTSRLMAYAVKLKICERWATMDDKAGFTKIENAISGNDKNKLIKSNDK
jgi:hypothetical protein